MATKTIDTSDRFKKIKITAVIIIVAVTLILCGIIGILIFNSFKLDSELYSRAVAVFKYEDKDINEGITEDDRAELANLFSGKILRKDNPSCGFSENIAVCFKSDEGERITFCIARDTCGIVYIKERDRYIHLSKKETKQLRAILANYEMTFPCI